MVLINHFVRPAWVSWNITIIRVFNINVIDFLTYRHWISYLIIEMTNVKRSDIYFKDCNFKFSICSDVFTKFDFYHKIVNAIISIFIGCMDFKCDLVVINCRNDNLRNYISNRLWLEFKSYAAAIWSYVIKLDIDYSLVCTNHIVDIILFRLV